MSYLAVWPPEQLRGALALILQVCRSPQQRWKIIITQEILLLVVSMMVQNVQEELS